MKSGWSSLFSFLSFLVTLVTVAVAVFRLWDKFVAAPRKSLASKKQESDETSAGDTTKES